MDKITDHYQAAIDRLASKFSDVPELLSIFGAGSAQVQALEDALWDLLVLRWIDTGEGAQLDTIGRIVLQARGPSVDAVYKLQLKARVKTIRSSGGPEEILSIFTLLHAGGVRLEEDFPAAFFLHLEEFEAYTNLDILLAYLRDARAEGVGAFLHVLTCAEEDAFTLSGPMTQLSGAHLSGLSVLNVSPNFPSEFPAQGFCLIDQGTPNEEVIEFLSRTANTITLATPTASNHADDTSIAAQITGEGWGDDGDPTAGGEFSGTWEA